MWSFCQHCLVYLLVKDATASIGKAWNLLTSIVYLLPEPQNYCQSTTVNLISQSACEIQKLLDLRNPVWSWKTMFLFLFVSAPFFQFHPRKTSAVEFYRPYHFVPCSTARQMTQRRRPNLALGYDRRVRYCNSCLGNPKHRCPCLQEQAHLRHLRRKTWWEIEERHDSQHPKKVHELWYSVSISTENENIAVPLFLLSIRT